MAKWERQLSTSVETWGTIRQLVLERDNYVCVSCGTALPAPDADIHHLLPRSMGGSDEPSNLVTLCDGCHAALHPTLAGSLANRWMERTAVRLARWLDREGTVSREAGNFGPALRLFGLNSFRAGQLPIVLAALAGESILVVSPTGSGKTLCFQMPAVLRKGVSVVVSPLKALMTDQVSGLLRKKIPATFINSDLNVEERKTRFKWLSNGAIKLLYVAPERFFVRNEEERQRIKQSKPSFLVVDEAHCVDQWGRDFRPEYSRLNEVRVKLGSPPVLAFTATAGKEMQQRILQSLGIPHAIVFVRDVDRPNIALLRWECPPDLRAQKIYDLLRLSQSQGGRAMVFVPTTKVGERLKVDLASLGLDTPFYHSRLGTAWDREQLLKRFSGEIAPFANQIICTNAFGMGLDLPNIRLVIHWQQAASIEDQLQELGRAGRDNKPAMSVMFFDRGGKDVSLLKYMAEMTVKSSVPEPLVAQTLDHRFQQIEQVSSMIKAKTCMRRLLREYFGQAISKKLSISDVIMNWVFGSKQRSMRSHSCCDYCDAAVITKRGPMEYVSRHLRTSS